MDKAKKKSIISETKSILLIIVLALFIRTFFLELFYVPTGSMRNTILEGDYIFSTKYDYGFSRYSIPFSPKIFTGRIWNKEPSPGDVIIMRPPHNMNERYIKRLIGMPGDKIQIIDNVIYINDKPIKRSYEGSFLDKNGNKFHKYKETLPNGASYFAYKSENNKDIQGIDMDNFGPYHVEHEKYFFLGDNRDNSGDSRYQLGTVHSENFIAKGRFIIFSSALELWDANISITEQVARVWMWISSVRLDRFFKALYIT
ncbi:MAG TPA: signal peptidase I [Candidatus Megaira endosymbiont of Nemacystus decipiens]|nr:signal peptidase I [Candidatus Megaera endosymbiont of Nemacystus decipiens]